MPVPPFGDLCAALLAEGRTVRFRADGASMEPAIRDGDVVTVAPFVGDVHRGDVLLYRTGGRLHAHRVVGPVRGAKEGIRVRGDAPGWEEERVPVADVLGRVETIERDGRAVPLRGPVGRRVAGFVGRLRGRLGRRS
jgi:signal peptidase I